MDRARRELLARKRGGARKHHSSRSAADHQRCAEALLARVAVFLIAVAVGAYGAALWLHAP
ncbi:hypothetical protein ACFW2Y_16715 [Streptomyces sp. NPDC058877]|uniref:hypothetical protein n=1 Tax=Streptomyces sp. NPDC058877 TaxID=3346665 RepID=UPI003691F16E